LPRWRCEGSRVRWNIDKHDGIRPDTRAIPNCDVASQHRSGRDIDVLANTGSAATYLRSADRHVVTDQAAVADNRIAVDDNRTLVQDPHSSTDSRCVMQLDPVEVSDESPQDVPNGRQCPSSRAGGEAQPPGGVPLQQQSMKPRLRHVSTMRFPILAHDREDLAERATCSRPAWRVGLAFGNAEVVGVRVLCAHGAKRNQLGRRLPTATVSS